MSDPLRQACLLDGIELVAPIGRGRFATVWGARWQGREVAVKLVDGPVGAGAPPRGLAHPGIARVLERGEVLGRRYLVLERFPTDLARLVDGRPLARALQRGVLCGLVDALEHAHARGLAHGDLKPANVLVDPGARPARVALIDFGDGDGAGDLDPGGRLEASLASSELTHAREAAATLAYLAPERRAGGGGGPAADRYALGVVLFEVLTGRRPVGLETPRDLRPELDRRWDLLTKALMARDPERRPPLGQVRRDVLRLCDAAGSERLEAAGPGAAAGLGPGADRDDDMVAIPGGFVVLGDRGDPDARPMVEVELAPFWLDRAPVTNRAYLEHVRATGAARPRAWPAGRLPGRLLDLPVTGVSWEEARAYAARLGKRLPTEAEWERAAQGPEHRRFPYGDAFDPARVPPPGRLAPVGSFPAGASSEGVLDLTGNGWEWTASPFGPHGAPPRADPAAARTIRGGLDPARPGSGSATFRAGLLPGTRDPHVGFRCARPAGPAPPPVRTPSG